MKPGTELEERHEKALRRLSAPSDLDQVLTVVTSKVAFSLAATLMLTVGIGSWAFWGRIPIKVSGNCLVMPPKGLFGVEAAAAGMVREIHCQAGQTVRRGDRLITVGDPQLTVQLEAAGARAATLRASLAELNQQISLEREAEQSAIRRELEAQEYTVERHLSDLNTARNALAMTSRLYEEGVVSRQQVDTDAQALRAQEVLYESSKANLATLRSKSIRSYRQEEYREKEMEWIAARDQYEALRTRQALGLAESPSAGRVLETLVSLGDYVEAGDPLVWLEHASTGAEPQWIHGYVPVQMGALMEPGVRVTVEFPTFGAQKYGSLVGRIMEVSPYAVSPENLRQVIKNSSLVQYLLGGQQAVIAVRIAPELDPGHITGYRWEGGQGPPGPLTSGMVGTFRAIVRRVAPITYVLPDLEG